MQTAETGMKKRDEEVRDKNEINVMNCTRCWGGWSSMEISTVAAQQEADRKMNFKYIYSQQPGGSPAPLSLTLSLSVSISVSLCVPLCVLFRVARVLSIHHVSHARVRCMAHRTMYITLHHVRAYTDAPPPPHLNPVVCGVWWVHMCVLSRGGGGEKLLPTRDTRGSFRVRHL